MSIKGIEYYVGFNNSNKNDNNNTVRLEKQEQNVFVLRFSILNTIYSMNKLVFSMKYGNNNNCDGLCKNSKNNNDSLIVRRNDTVCFQTMVSDTSVVWILYNINNIIYNKDTDNNNIGLNKILYDCNKMNFILIIM